VTLSEGYEGRKYGIGIFRKMVVLEPVLIHECAEEAARRKLKVARKERDEYNYFSVPRNRL
jgi:hypothetical protein